MAKQPAPGNIIFKQELLKNGYLRGEPLLHGAEPAKGKGPLPSDPDFSGSRALPRKPGWNIKIEEKIKKWRPDCESPILERMNFRLRRIPLTEATRAKVNKMSVKQYMERVMLEVSESQEADNVYRKLALTFMEESLGSSDLGLVNLMGTYYDPNQVITFHTVKLEMWPGFTITDSDNTDNEDFNFTMGIKFLYVSSKSLLEVLKDRRNCVNDAGKEQEMMQTMVGQTVYFTITGFVYKINRLRSESPMDFYEDGSVHSFAQHFKKVYKRDLDWDQPLLQATRVDDVEAGEIHIITPQYCYTIGVTEHTKKNTNFWSISAHIREQCALKAELILGNLLGLFSSSLDIVNELESWLLEFYKPDDIEEGEDTSTKSLSEMKI